MTAHRRPKGLRCQQVFVLSHPYFHPFTPASGSSRAQADDQKRRILDATDIVDVVGEHITLKPQGREFRCLCPFHDDRNPSMCVVPHKQMFHCFVCGAGGDALTFVMKYHGMGFPEALEYLGQRAGIEVTRVRQKRQAPLAPGEPSRDDLAQAAAFAQSFFQTIRRHAEHGANAREAIERRGIDDAMVDAFGIGAAPEGWDGLVRTAQQRGVDEAALLGVGLLKRREGGGVYDALRHRLIFPIHDQAGRPIAFGGRRLDDEDEPKYLNTSESILFDKGATLYGLAQGGRSIRAQRRAIVTEGYTDVVACHQHGFTNVVATLGTALTEKHARLLRRMCDEVVLLFDGDEAGQRAADRAFEVFFPEAMDVRVVVLPDNADPDDLLKRPGGADAFKRAIDEATDVLEHRVRRLEASLTADGHRAGSAARGRVVEQTVRRLSELGLDGLPPVRRRAVLDRLAALAGVDRATVAEAARSGRSHARATARDTQASEVPRPAHAAQHALACILEDGRLAHRSPDDTRLVLERCADDEGLGPLVARMTDLFERGDDPDVRSVIEDGTDERETAPALALAHAARALAADDLATVFADCVERVRLEGRLRENRDASDASDALEAAIAARRAHSTNAAGLTREATRAVRPRATPNTLSTPSDGGPPREA